MTHGIDQQVGDLSGVDALDWAQRLPVVPRDLAAGTQRAGSFPGDVDEGRQRRFAAHELVDAAECVRGRGRRIPVSRMDECERISSG